MTAQGLTQFAHCGMLSAAEAMALTAVHILTDPKALTKIKAEHNEKLAKNPYICPIPSYVNATTQSK